MKQGSSNNDVSESQIGSIVNSYEKGLLNRGTNYDINGLPNQGLLFGSQIFNMSNTKGRSKRVNR